MTIENEENGIPPSNVTRETADTFLRRIIPDYENELEVILAEWFIGEEEPGASLVPGLGLIDFEIYPHFEDKLLPQIKKLWKKDQGKLYMIKNG